MALITCPDCGKQISDRASFCPNCGCPSSAWRSGGIPSTLRVGDRFKMGSWGGQSIEWRVLNVSGTSALVISECGLDRKPFNQDWKKGIDWYSSDLRFWLTGAFFSGAFSYDEKLRIKEITCLSVEEAERYFKDNNDRICKPTAYASGKVSGSATTAAVATGGCVPP